MRTMIGRTISHYRILEKLGEGGMGVVYRAEDTKLKRTVALKFLPHGLETHEPERARFLQEAQAAAALNHPNICTIHDIATEGEQQFIVMEYIDGHTLRQLVTRNPKPETIIPYAIQIGEALQEAHSKGIIHRDVKTDNIMVNSKNQVKVMDFGLAKLKGAMKLTRTSSTVGTLAYMAPEHIEGHETDARSDIFSFGVVLYETLTGHLPFRGEHDAAMMYSIVNEEPQPLQTYLPHASPELLHVVNRALEKDPEDRYQTAQDMLIDLRRLKKETSKVFRVLSRSISVPESAERDPAFKDTTQFVRAPFQRFLWPSVIFALLIVIIGTYLLFIRPEDAINSIAVLPFTNASADSNSEYLCDGIPESLINRLAQLSNLTVMSRSSVFRYKGKETDPQLVGKELGVQAVLTGRLTQRGRELVISTELIEVSKNKHIWGEHYKRDLSDLIDVQEEISKEIAEKLRLKLADEETKKLTKRYTENSEAYELYLKGLFYWNKRTGTALRTAVEYFNQAIHKDPSFAMAYAGLGSAYILIPEYGGLSAHTFIPKARDAAIKGLELDPSLAEAHAVLGLVKTLYDYDWEGAQRELRRAIELNPTYATAHHWYFVYLQSNGRFSEALAEITRAQQIDPLSLTVNANVAEAFSCLREYDKAIEQCRKTLALDPNFAPALSELAYAYRGQGRFNDAIVEFQKARTILGNVPSMVGELGITYAQGGKRREALGSLDELFAFSKRGYSASFEIACIYFALGEEKKTFQWLDKAYDERNARLAYSMMFPDWDPLRSDPRFIALLKKMGLRK